MDHQDIHKALDEIINSTTFSKSEHAKTLLDYLTKATLEGRDVKEYTIANELFHKESDSGVRSYIHNLRKKLIEYYETEGVNAELIFSIPKGQYIVHIEPGRSNRGRFFAKRKFMFLSFIVIVILITAIIGFISERSSHKIEDTFVWENIMKAKEPILIVVGDNYFFGEDHMTTGGKGTVRDFDINSDNDFNNYLISHPNMKDSIYKINWSYMTKEVAYSLFKIAPYFKNRDQVRMMLASELTYDDIKKYNIFFLGKYNTVGILKEPVFNKFYNINPETGELTYYQEDTVYHDTLKIDNVNKEDYPLVVKFSIPNKKSIFMFVAADDPGLTAALDYFLNIHNVEYLQNMLKLSNEENNFSALFKVKGLGRVDYSIDFISGEKLDN